MKDRRAFLKTSLLAAGAAIIARPAWTRAASGGFPPGVVYSSGNQGKWEGKAGSHAPKVEVKGGSVSVTTAHPMTARICSIPPRGCSLSRLNSLE